MNETSDPKKSLNFSEFHYGSSDIIKQHQYELFEMKKKHIKLKSRIRSYQLVLEEQDEKLNSLQEAIAKKKSDRKDGSFDWTCVETAHLISKIFENCEPTNEQISEVNSEDYAGIAHNPENPWSPVSKSNCLYTADFHRFAIAVYFFSPKAYFLLSNIFPMFPHRNYIRQWVVTGRVEKLFPKGVYRDEFNE